MRGRESVRSIHRRSMYWEEDGVDDGAGGSVEEWSGEWWRDVEVVVERKGQCVEEWTREKRWRGRGGRVWKEK